MNLLDRAIGYVAPGAALRRAQDRRTLAGVQRRSYDAARPSRATAGWRRPFTSARSETYVGLPMLRASSHDVFRNNPYGAKIVGDLVKDMVGSGIVARANTGSKARNKAVDAVAREFFRAMDADGTSSNYAGFQTLMARGLFDGGETVVRRIRQPRSMGLPLPLQFQAMEGELLDNTRNFVTPDGNRVIQGIEFKVKTRQRVAYWLYPEHPGDSYVGGVGGGFASEPVPADEIHLLMEPQRLGQLRGTPWMTPSLVRARLLDDYEDAEQQRKRTESASPLLVKNAPGQVGEASENSGASLWPTMTDVDGNLVEVMEPGLVAYLKDAAGVETIPIADSASFVGYKRSAVQSIAAGARSLYELASGDLSQTNYSSIQYGTLSYRGMIEQLRATRFIPVLEWIWRCMIDVAVAIGRLPEDTPYGVDHHCPPWPQIDPVKAADANKVMMRTGEKSLIEVIIARGKDPEDHLDEIRRSNALLDRYGLVLDSDPRLTDGRGVNQAIAAAAAGGEPKAKAPDLGADPDTPAPADDDAPEGSGDADAGTATPSED